MIIKTLKLYRRCRYVRTPLVYECLHKWCSEEGGYLLKWVAIDSDTGLRMDIALDT